MNARRTPQPVGQAHLSDQATDLVGYPRPTATRARLPAPVQSEAHPMRPNYGLRLDHREGAQHGWEQPIEPDEDHSVGDRQSRLRRNLSTQDIQLMSENRDLGFESRLHLER